MKDLENSTSFLEEKNKNIALEVHNLRVSYEQRPVLWDIDFQFTQGQIIGVIGPNGSGKTTLIKAMLGFLPIDSGYVEFFGKPLKKVKKQIAYIPQRSSIDWDYPISVFEVVLMARYQTGKFWYRYTSEDKEQALEALRKVKLLDFAYRQIGQLSGGQQQRVFIARALAQEAEIYVMDEPFVGVDTTTEEIILNILTDLKKNGKTMLVVHHDLETVQHYFDSAVLLNTRLVAFGDVKKVFQRENLQNTFKGQPSILTKLADIAVEESFPLNEKISDFNDKK